MNEKKDEDFISRIQESVGEDYMVEESNSTGDIQVRNRDVVVFRIYQSLVRDGKPYILKLDVEEHREISERVAKELGVELSREYRNRTDLTELRN